LLPERELLGQDLDEFRLVRNRWKFGNSNSNSVLPVWFSADGARVGRARRTETGSETSGVAVRLVAESRRPRARSQTATVQPNDRPCSSSSRSASSGSQVCTHKPLKAAWM